MAPKEHYAKHQWGQRRFRRHRGLEPVPLEPTLLDVVQRFDAFLKKRLQAPLRPLVTVESVGMHDWKEE